MEENRLFLSPLLVPSSYLVNTRRKLTLELSWAVRLKKTVTVSHLSLILCPYFLGDNTVLHKWWESSGESAVATPWLTFPFQGLGKWLSFLSLPTCWRRVRKDERNWGLEQMFPLSSAYWEAGRKYPVSGHNEEMNMFVSLVLNMSQWVKVWLFCFVSIVARKWED